MGLRILIGPSHYIVALWGEASGPVAKCGVGMLGFDGLYECRVGCECGPTERGFKYITC